MRRADRHGVQEFLDLGWLDKGPADIFRLKNHRDELLGREGWKEKSVDNLFAAIEAKRSPDAARLLFGLGIRHIGAVTARDLLKGLGDIAVLPAKAPTCAMVSHCRTAAPRATSRRARASRR